jgi:hypothetical protein
MNNKYRQHEDEYIVQMLRQAQHDRQTLTNVFELTSSVVTLSLSKGFNSQLI